MRNGTDRDIALQIVADMETISEKIATINNNLYHVVILTQPTDQEVAITERGTFSVVAANVTAYQWQYQAGGVGDWLDVNLESLPTANTADFTFQVTVAAIYLRNYRCKMTGKDGEVVYSNVVKVTEPESNG